LNFLTAGESHGKNLTGIIDDYPSGVRIDRELLRSDLDRRQRGFGRGGRMDIENDEAVFTSGIRNGITTGSPISFFIPNKDWEKWKDIITVFPDSKVKAADPILNPRPGHADLNGYLKYRPSDIRDVIERSSARETAARVCIGAVAKSALEEIGIKIYSYVTRVGDIGIKKYIKINPEVLKIIEESELRCPDLRITEMIKEKISDTAKMGDTLGGGFRVMATGTPPGLGSYSQWNKRIDGILARAFMSIPAIKEVEIGSGLTGSLMTGTQFHDEISYDKDRGFYREKNMAGGIEGGITNGEDIIINASMKPIPTTVKGIGTVNIKTKEKTVSLKERSDVCAVPAASIVGEAVLAIELLSLVQDKFGHDSISEMKRNLSAYMESIKNI